MTLPEFPLAAGFVAVMLGLLSGAALTLMDRIDEHRVIDRCRTPLAYLAATATAAGMAGSIHLIPSLYPFLFVMCLEWIIKNKVDYPSHVFFLFLLALYFGWRLDLFWEYFLYVFCFSAFVTSRGRCCVASSNAARPSSVGITWLTGKNSSAICCLRRRFPAWGF